VSGFACATDGLATVTPPLSGEQKPAPHIALLLPLKSASFGAAAEAVQRGFLAAAGLEQHRQPKGLAVRVYGCTDESRDIAALYRQALANGARAVVGPMTRNGVGALAAGQATPVPTLTLNSAKKQPSGQLYFFGMEAEAEARLAAQLARQQGLHQAIVIATRTQLAQRLQFAFEEEWHDSGGAMLREIEFSADHAVFADIADMPDTVLFLAVDAEQARLIRPYLPNKLPIYATSQIFIGNNETLTNYDLNGIRFVDMPWLLQADHPAVMIYPRADPPLPADLERFYALGIDAFRLIQLLLDGNAAVALPLDGVSGQIQLNGHTFQRASIPAIFAQGHAQPPDAVVAPPAPMFPDQAVRKP
jgi:outer membrane PBP1 activator LpoA protein